MWRILVISLTLTWMSTTESTRPRSPTSSRYYRQNMYNFRPQSTLIEDEQEYRSYDNNFPDFRSGSSQSYRQSRQPPLLPLPQLTSSRPRYHNSPPPNFHDDDDYSNDSDLPDDDDLDLDQGGRSTFNFRPSYGGGGGGRPNIISQAQHHDAWNDISGPGRGDASYSFGYNLRDQSRHESSDPNGNVNGDFSFVDDEGTFRKISYTAGAHKGFVVQRKEPPSESSSHRRPSNSIKIKPTIITIPESPRPPQHHSSSKNNNNGDPDVSPSPPPANNKGSSGGSRPPNVGGGSLSSGKPWGVLGQNHQFRPRKRKPALVVKVKRPAQHQHQSPAWMYYRPPNPGRPVDGSTSNSDSGWQSKKPSLPSPPLSSSSYNDAGDDGDNGQWTESENEIVDDGYPKDKSYSFGYNTGDQTRQEVSDAWGNIRGSYSYLDPSGVTRTVHYTAGHSGFKILNAQPSILRPVYTEAPPVQSIPIPIAVHHPQPSAIVYHIHPDGGVGADWKPWEPTRTTKHSYQRRRRTRPHSQQILQPNSFHLTHSNHRFFPAYSNIYDQPPSTTNTNNQETDAETILPTLSRHRIEEDPQFLKHIQQQIRHSNKLKRLQQQYRQQQQVFVYQRNRPSRNNRQPPQSLRNRLLNVDSTGEEETLTASEDQHFSDYEAAVQSNPVTLQRRLERKNQKERQQGKKGSQGLAQNQLDQQQQQQQQNSRNEDIRASPSPSSPDNLHTLIIDVQGDNLEPTQSTDGNQDPTVVGPTAKMEVEGEDHHIQPYNGGYGDKNPLLVITERESPAARLRKISMSSREKSVTSSSSSPGDNLVAESIVSPALAIAMSLVMPETTTTITAAPIPEPQSKERVRMHIDHSMEKAMSNSSKSKTTTPTPSTSSNKPSWMSPATLLAAKMSSPVPKTSISAITMPGRVIHYPGGKFEIRNSNENVS